MRSNAAISAVISTLILTSVLLVVVTTASFFANDILNNKVEDVEFEQAINTMLSVEIIARGLMFKPYSSGSIKTSFPTTSPYFDEGGNLTVFVNDSEYTSIPVNTFKIEGGPNVGVSLPTDFVGNDSFFLTGFEGSLSRVQTYQLLGAWVSLDYARIRCTYSGLSEFYNGSGFEMYNLVEVILIQLTSGTIDLIDRSRVIVENIGNNISQIEVEGDFWIKAQFSEKEQTFYLTDLGGDPGCPTLLNFIVIQLKISTLGGG